MPKIRGNFAARRWHADCKERCPSQMRIPSLVFFCASVLALSCSSQKQANDPGPAQRAGANMDEGAEKAKESAKEAGQKVGNATEKASNKLDEKSGD